MDVALLKGTSFFSSGIQEEDLKQIASLFVKETHKAGDVLLKEGDPQTKIITLESGKVRRLKKVETDGKLVEIGTFSKGEVPGLLHSFKQDPSFATLECVEDSVVWVLESDQFRELLKKNDRLMFDVMGALSKQVRSQKKILDSTALNKDRVQAASQGTKIKVIFYDSKKWVIEAFNNQLKTSKYSELFEVKYTKSKLSVDSVIQAAGYQVVCVFVNDNVDKDVVKALSRVGVKMIALRCAGFDRVDLEMSEALGITVARVPAYSPYAVAEHTIALLLALNRKIHKAYNRTREGNFSLDGLLGFDLYGKTAGVIGTGKIGVCVVNILQGFGCKVLCYDIFINKELEKRDGVKYVDLDTLYTQSDMIFIHAPLTPQTQHMINADSIAKMKPGVVLVNTSRGALIDTAALVDALEKGHIHAAGLDVYEKERDYFFQNWSDGVIPDELLRKLLAMKNVIVTGHQAFFTQEALENIVKITLDNITTWHDGKTLRQHPNGVFKA